MANTRVGMDTRVLDAQEASSIQELRAKAETKDTNRNIPLPHQHH